MAFTFDLKYHSPTTNFYIDKNINNAYLSGTDSLPLIRFHCFDNLEWMDAALSTRMGGVSTAHLSSLNLGMDRGDAPENVAENYHRLSRAFNISDSSIVKTHQVHKTSVRYAGSDHLPAGYEALLFPDTDGLYTDVPGLTLCISVADCVPVYLADPVTGQIALVHSGWKGTVGKISPLAVEKLMKKGSVPENLIGLIGPSISMENYEVSLDVVEMFQKVFNPEQLDDIAIPKDDDHYQLDLWAACYHSLVDAGLLPENICFSSICTYENHDLLYSHRFTNGLRGNQNALMVIKNNSGVDF